MTRLLALTLLIGFFAFLPSASADGENGLFIIPADVHQSASSGTAMLTLNATNIQVRAKWRLDGDSPFAITDNGELRLTAELSNPATIVATVIVEDMFSELNSGYQNLAATALITVEFMFGTLRIINPPARLLAASGMGGTMAFHTSGGMGERIFGIDSASDYFTLGETSGILSVAASVVVGEYAMTIWVQDETATLSITVVAEVGVPENLIVVGIPPLTITVGDVLALHTLQASGGLGTITYKMLGSAGHFFIGKKSGVLRVNGGASEGVYMLSVEAADGAIIPQKATAVATVAVEKKKVNPLILRTEVTDISIILHVFTLQYANTYAIAAGNDGGHFAISEIGGTLWALENVPEGAYTLSVEITYQYSSGIPPTKLISVVVVEMSLIPPPIKSEIFVFDYGDGGLDYGGDVWSSVDGKLWTLKTANASWWLYQGYPVEYNGRLYFISGDDIASSENGVNATPETGDAPWQQERYGYQVVSHNGRLYMLGGDDSDGIYYNDVWSSVNGREWTQETANADWAGREDHQVVSHNGRLYVLGGRGDYDGDIADRDYTYYGDVWSSVDGKSWVRVTLSGSWAGRSGHQAVSHNGRLYVLGGWSCSRPSFLSISCEDWGETYYNDVWSSVDGKSWTQETWGAGWSERYDHRAVSHNGRLYVLGGNDEDFFPFLNDVWSSADGKSWRQETEAAGWEGFWGGPNVVVFPPNLVLHSADIEFKIPNGHIGIIETFEAQYGDGNYIYSLLSDISGLSLSINGELSTDGTTATGEHTITVQVEDGVGQTATWTGKVIIICAHCKKQ
ncbi:MAG: Kelch repeat-containing protein [Gammaproteobacteria bacterium]